MKIRNAMSTTLLLTLRVSALGPPFTKSCCRLVMRGGWVRVYCESMAIGWPTE